MIAEPLVILGSTGTLGHAFIRLCDARGIPYRALGRKQLMADGVWANEPVPLFPYPGSPDYTRLWGPPDEQAWERAHDHYLRSFDSFSDVQEKRPVRLRVLEGRAG